MYFHVGALPREQRGHSPPRAWWRKRRVLLSTFVVLLFVAAPIIALVLSDRSQIVIYNNTGSTVGPLPVRACGQEFRFSQIPEETSVRVRLKKEGPESGVELMLASANWHWDGSYIEPHGGYIVFIHVRRGSEVETNTQFSIWQQMLFGRGAGY